MIERVLEIRECGEDDLDPLERCMPTGGQHAHAGHFARQREGTATYLIAWQDAAAVGCCLILWDGCVAPEARAALPDAVEFSNLHVRAETRGRGVGTALIRAAEQRAAAAGRAVAAVSVGVENPRAAALYQRLGYQNTGLQWTARYIYPDHEGVDREVVEHNVTLTKRIGNG